MVTSDPNDLAGLIDMLGIDASIVAIERSVVTTASRIACKTCEVAHYIVAQITIEDRQRYAEYEAGFMDVFASYDGTMLAVDEAPHVVEGAWSCTRTVIIEFPSRDQALAWYNSDAYQQIAEHRHAASTGNVAIVAGLS